MTDPRASEKDRYKRMLRWQIVVSWIFVLIGFSVPVHVAVKYGVYTVEIYDRSGAVIGTANYLVLGAGLGLFAIVMGAIGILMARRSLKKMNKRDGGN